MQNAMVFEDTHNQIAVGVRVGEVDFDLSEVLKERFGDQSFSLMIINKTILEERQNAKH